MRKSMRMVRMLGMVMRIHTITAMDTRTMTLRATSITTITARYAAS